MNHKSFYQKPDGNFFLARNDDKTRSAYKRMGFKITDRKIVPAIVMTPRIEEVETEEEILSEYLQHFPLIVVDREPTTLVEQLIKLLEDLPSWTGTAAELLDCIDVEFDAQNLGIQLAKKDIKAGLQKVGICISKFRSGGQRMMVIKYC